MEIQTYGDFSAEIHRKLLGQRMPVNGTIEATLRCPLTCSHCYNNLPMGDQEARRGELTYEEHCRVLDEIAEAGCLWLLYTGGEIFARGDFLHIYTYAKQKGLLITLFTNGTLVTPKVADHLAVWRPFAIEITLYGRTKETYERLTGIPGSYERCMRGIRLLTERRLPLKLKTVAVTINTHEVWEMKRFVEEDLGLEFKFDAMINPRIDCSQSPLAVRLTPEEVVELDLKDPRRAGDWRQFAGQVLRPAHSPEANDEVYHCGGGLNAFAIDPYGKLSICALSHVDTYNLRQGSFREGWARFLLAVRKKTITRPSKCRACHLTNICGMCPAMGELETGDPEQPVEFLCQVGHLRAHAFDLPVPPHGACEYCEGGVGYERLVRSAAAIRNGRPRERPSPLALRVVGVPEVAAGNGCSGGGCGSCSLAAVHGSNR